MTRLGQDTGAGLLFIAFGLAGLWFGADLELGSAQEMGPGYVPATISWVIVTLGVIVLARGLAAGSEPIGPVSPRAIASVALALAVFAVTISTFGLLLATCGTVFAAMLGYPGMRWHEGLALGVALAAAAALLFVWLLRIPFHLLPV